MSGKLANIKPSHLKKAFAAALLGIATVTGGYMYASLDAAPLKNEGETAVTVQKTANVNIKDFKFSPENLTVQAGTRVEWINRDEAPHNAVDNGKTFETPMLNLNGKHGKTLAMPGTYTYICSIHPFMVGTIKVVP